MKAKEFMRETGATHRQLDNWYHHGIVLCKDYVEGQGNHRVYDPAKIPMIRILVEISDVFGNQFSVELLKLIAKHYEEGHILISNNVAISWRLYVDRTDASPEGGSTVSG